MPSAYEADKKNFYFCSASSLPDHYLTWESLNYLECLV